MLTRLITLLAICAVSFVAIATSAHAARMNTSSCPDCVTHAGEMRHSAGVAQVYGDEGHGTSSAEAAACEFVCQGISVGLTLPVIVTAFAYKPVRFGMSMKQRLATQIPDLNGHPPKLRLL